MNILHTPLILLLLAAAADQPAPKLPVGKETTFVTGPLDKEGYIDYEAALKNLLRKKVRPETNANVLLWKAIGPKPEGKRMPAEFYKQLGIDEPSQHGDYFLGLETYVKEHVKRDRPDDPSWAPGLMPKPPATKVLAATLENELERAIQRI